jgi:hypothetical protein
MILYPSGPSCTAISTHQIAAGRCRLYFFNSCTRLTLEAANHHNRIYVQFGGVSMHVLQGSFAVQIEMARVYLDVILFIHLIGQQSVLSDSAAVFTALRKLHSSGLMPLTHKPWVAC